MYALPQAAPNLTRHPIEQYVIHQSVSLREHPHGQQEQLPSRVLAHSM